MIRNQGISSIVGSILLVAVVIASIAVISMGIFEFRERAPTKLPSGALMDFEETSEGMLVKPTRIEDPVTIKLDGKSITKISKNDIGKRIFLPTSPGDRLTVTSSTGNGEILVNKKIHKGEAGDFIAHYRFDSDGENVIDRTGNGNTGELIDNPTWVSDGETGLRFDGDEDGVRVPSLSSEIKVSELTVAVSYRPERGDKKQELLEHINPDGTNWVLELKPWPSGDNYQIAFSVDKAGGSQTGQFLSPEYSAGKRHVAVGTFDGKNYELYVDGKKQGSDSFGSNQKVGVGELTIGRDAEAGINDYLDGTIYEVRLYYTVFDDRRIDILTEAMRAG